MPTSRPYHLSWLCQKVLDMHPESILDIGIGFGSKGMLFREYTDIWALRYNKFDWKTRIDGVEIFPGYISELQNEIYDTIYTGDILSMDIDNYDLIHMGDVIEHISKQEGIKLINRLITKCAKLIIITPIKVLQQGVFMGNVAETHVSQWTPDDFPGADVGTIGGAMVIEYTGEKVCIPQTS